MIINKREFNNEKRYEIDFCGRPLVMEVGKLADIVIADGKVRTKGNKDDVFPTLLGEFDRKCGLRGSEEGADNA